MKPAETIEDRYVRLLGIRSSDLPMLFLKPVDLSKIRLERRQRKGVKGKCIDDFWTHPDIKQHVPYLALIKWSGDESKWCLVRFHEVWFGLTADDGMSFEQLVYGENGKDVTHFQALYELPEPKIPKKPVQKKPKEFHSTSGYVGQPSVEELAQLDMKGRQKK